MDYLGAGADIVSGEGLPALYSIAGGAALGIVAGGAALAVLLALTRKKLQRHAVRCPYGWEPSVCDAVFIFASLLRVSLDSAKVFQLASRMDSDVGAELCVIPLYFVICFQGSSSSEYMREARVVSSVLNAVTLVSAVIYSQSSDANLPARPAPTAVEQALAFTNVAYGSTAEEGVIATAARGVIFVLLSAFPKAFSALAYGDVPGWLFVLHTCLLTQSALTHAGKARRLLFKVGRQRSPQRTLMLLAAPAVAVGFAFQWKDPQQASVALLPLVLLLLFTWVLQWTPGRYRD